MGLLAKALHGAEQPPSSQLPSREALSEIEARLRAIRPQADRLLAAFSLLSELLPFPLLGLLLPAEEGLLPAAVKGFACPRPSPLASTLPSELKFPGAPLPAEARRSVHSAFGLSSELPLFGASLSAAEDAGPGGLWLYSYPGAEASGQQGQRLLGSLFSSAPLSEAPGFGLTSIAADPCSELLAAIPADQVGLALRFDLGELSARAGQRYPGLQPGVAESLVLSAAASLLSSRGKALLAGPERVALVLVSPSPIDPELALFQFRKSFARSLSFLEGFEFPQGDCIALDPSEAGALESLSRFLAS